MRQQDAEYEEALRVDQLRAQQRREEEAQLAQDEERRRQDLLVLQEMRERAAQTLPPEPEGPSAATHLTLRFRLPDGRLLQRAFPRQSPVDVLYNFMLANGLGNVELAIGAPRIVLPGRQAAVTVNQAVLGQNLVLMVTPGTGKATESFILPLY